MHGMSFRQVEAQKLAPKWEYVSCRGWEFCPPLRTEQLFFLLQPYYNPVQEEVLLLPVVGNMVYVERLHVGEVGSCPCDPKVLFRVLLTQYPTCVEFIVAHNHPGGTRAEPSSEDEEVFDRIHEAAMLMGYELASCVVFTDRDIWRVNYKGSHWSRKLSIDDGVYWRL